MKTPITPVSSHRSVYFRRWQSFVVLLSFIVNTLGPVPFVQAEELRLPVPGEMVHLSALDNPSVLKGVTVYPNDPFKFDFILDKGDNSPSLKETSKLVKYFLASITTPENDLWVNLSPYEKNRVIPEIFGQTDMGRDLLAEDYILKQVTASLIYPEGQIGKQFWKRVYEEAQKKFGTTNIPVNTFNKVWIVPDHAKVYEHGNTAFVVKASLKVMLEQDYLSMSKHQMLTESPTRGHVQTGTTKNVSPSTLPSDEALNVKALQGNNQPQNEINNLGSQIVREIVIPQLEKEVNEGKNFATLRQVYYSMILAVWFKKHMKDSILGHKYMDQNKVRGIHYENNLDPEAIYQRYLKAFKKGVYNYIKEEADPMSQEMIPRKYFSGGFFGDVQKFSTERIDWMDKATIADINTATRNPEEVDVTLGAPAIQIPSVQPDPVIVAKLAGIEADLRGQLASKRETPRYYSYFDQFRIIARSGERTIYADPNDPKSVYKVIYGNNGDDGIREISNLIVLEGVPNLPRYLDWGVTNDGAIWIHMQEIENAMSIETSRWVTSEIWSRFSFSQRLDKLAKVAEILEAVHEKGISHNDVKPLNILINEQGDVMLIDWEIAKPLGVKQGRGTSPFQAKEEIKQDQSDVWSLRETMVTALSPCPPNMKDLENDLNGLYQRMNNEFYPNKRPTMKEVAQELRELAQRAIAISDAESTFKFLPEVAESANPDLAMNERIEEMREVATLVKADQSSKISPAGVSFYDPYRNNYKAEGLMPSVAKVSEYGRTSSQKRVFGWKGDTHGFGIVMLHSDLHPEDILTSLGYYYCCAIAIRARNRATGRIDVGLSHIFSMLNGFNLRDLLSQTQGELEAQGYEVMEYVVVYQDREVEKDRGNSTQQEYENSVRDQFQGQNPGVQVRFKSRNSDKTDIAVDQKGMAILQNGEITPVDWMPDLFPLPSVAKFDLAMINEDEMQGMIDKLNKWAEVERWKFTREVLNAFGAHQVECNVRFLLNGKSLKVEFDQLTSYVIQIPENPLTFQLLLNGLVKGVQEDIGPFIITTQKREFSGFIEILRAKIAELSSEIKTIEATNAMMEPIKRDLQAVEDIQGDLPELDLLVRELKDLKTRLIISYAGGKRSQTLTVRKFIDQFKGEKSNLNIKIIKILGIDFDINKVPEDYLDKFDHHWIKEWSENLGDEVISVMVRFRSGFTAVTKGNQEMLIKLAQNPNVEMITELRGQLPLWMVAVDKVSPKQRVQGYDWKKGCKIEVKALKDTDIQNATVALGTLRGLVDKVKKGTSNSVHRRQRGVGLYLHLGADQTMAIEDARLAVTTRRSGAEILEKNQPVIMIGHIKSLNPTVQNKRVASFEISQGSSVLDLDQGKLPFTWADDPNLQNIMLESADILDLRVHTHVVVKKVVYTRTDRILVVLHAGNIVRWQGVKDLAMNTKAESPIPAMNIPVSRRGFIQTSFWAALATALASGFPQEAKAVVDAVANLAPQVALPKHKLNVLGHIHVDPTLYTDTYKFLDSINKSFPNNETMTADDMVKWAREILKSDDAKYILPRYKSNVSELKERITKNHELRFGIEFSEDEISDMEVIADNYENIEKLMHDNGLNIDEIHDLFLMLLGPALFLKYFDQKGLISDQTIVGIDDQGLKDEAVSIIIDLRAQMDILGKHDPSIIKEMKKFYHKEMIDINLTTGMVDEGWIKPLRERQEAILAKNPGKYFKDFEKHRDIIEQALIKGLEDADLFKKNLTKRDDNFYKRSQEMLKKNDLDVIFGRIHAQPLYDKFKDDSSVDATIQILSQRTINEGSVNAAMAVRGGIDLTAKRMDLEIEKDKAAVSQPMDLKVLENIEINGLYIKDIEVKPLKDLPEMLGVSSH